MKNKDISQKFLFENASIRGEIVRLNETYQTIINQHDYPQALRQLLGEILVAASLISASVKFKGRITIQFQGNGKLKLLLAQCTHEFHLRALAQWNGDFDQAELKEQLKDGILVITMDPDSGKRYQGIVAWEGNSLTESLEGYFKKSEQLPTRLWLAIDENTAAGLLLQVMPREAARLGKETLEDNDWEHIIHLTSTITSPELLELENETILKRLYVEEEVRVFQPEPIRFQCTCSEKRSANAILLAGKDEIEEELQEKQQIVVTCDFCNREFIFDRVDIANIFKQGNSPDTSSQIH